MNRLQILVLQIRMISTNFNFVWHGRVHRHGRVLQYHGSHSHNEDVNRLQVRVPMDQQDVYQLLFLCHARVQQRGRVHQYHGVHRHKQDMNRCHILVLGYNYDQEDVYQF